MRSEERAVWNGNGWCTERRTPLLLDADHRARESHGLTREPWSSILPEEVQDTLIALFRSRLILEDTHGRPPIVVPL